MDGTCSSDQVYIGLRLEKVWWTENDWAATNEVSPTDFADEVYGGINGYYPTERSRYSPVVLTEPDPAGQNLDAKLRIDTTQKDFLP